MTPRKLDDESILSKLRTMRRLLDELDSLGTITQTGLASDYGTQLIIERVLSQLVDLAGAINTHVAAVVLGEAPHDLRRSFDIAAHAGVITKDLADRLAPSTGMRNVLVHAYLDLDMDRFVAAVPHALEQYGEYVRQAAGWLRQQQQ